MTEQTLPDADVTVEIAGTEYDLRLDMEAMADFEHETGKNILELLADTGQIIAERSQQDTTDDAELSKIGLEAIQKIIRTTALSAADLRVLIWACMGGEDSDLSLRETGRLITMNNIVEVWQAISNVIENALPDVEETDEDAGPMTRQDG